MNKRDRIENPADSFDGGYHLLTEEKHRQRVADSPNRIQYAIQQLEAHNIEYVLKNENSGHFHCRRKTDDALIQFWAGTGKIMGRNRLRGIHNLIRICEGETDET